MTKDMTLAQAYEVAIEAILASADDAGVKAHALAHMFCYEHSQEQETRSIKRRHAAAVLKRHRALVANAERLREAAYPLADQFMKRKDDLVELRKVLRAIKEGTLPRKPQTVTNCDTITNSRIEDAVDNCSIISNRLTGLERNVSYIFSRLATLDRTVAEMKLPASDDCNCLAARKLAINCGHAIETWHCPVHGGQTFIFSKDHKGVDDEAHK